MCCLNEVEARDGVSSHGQAFLVTFVATKVTKKGNTLAGYQLYTFLNLTAMPKYENLKFIDFQMVPGGVRGKTDENH